ncbi:MAG: thioredoxin family protein [Terriglobales bacterium]
MRVGALRSIVWIAILLVIVCALPGSSAQVVKTSRTSGVSVPLEQWKSVLLSGDAPVLRTLYSITPQTKITTANGVIDTDADVAFWTDLKVRKIKIDLVKSDAPQRDLQSVFFQAEIQSAASTPARTLYITEGQIWQLQGEQWRMVVEQRTNPARLLQPTSTDKDIYHPGADAHAEIKHALLEAAKAHKRVIVVFGANWCFDCHVLDAAFHRPDLAGVLAQSYEVVHVDVGRGDQNQDLMAQYQVPMKRGIPGLAVLDGSGKLLFSQQNGEFENARALGPEDLLQFLKKWKPQAR